MVRRADRNGESSFGAESARVMRGIKKDESMQAGENGYKTIWENVQTNLNTRRGDGPFQ